MKKKLLICLFIFACVFCLTACTSNNSKDKEFTIKCESKTKQDGVVQNTTITNKFDYQDQYSKSSELVIVATYEKEDEYKASKAVFEQMASTNTDKNYTYKVNSNDDTKTINFSYTAIYNKEELLKKDDKDDYKAINVLKKSEESSGIKCTVDGIKREDIK